MGSEYKSENFEQLSELGITIINLPSYRPELKESVEKFFDLIQDEYKKHFKLYLALLRSLQKKGTKLAVKQAHENFKSVRNQDYVGIMGGSDPFTIIGCSGIGKSSAIMRAENFITENRIIEVEKPYCKVVPCVIVQCPFDSSVKGLLLEILRKIDEVLDSKYYENAVKARATVDMLIGSVSQVALNHIGLQYGALEYGSDFCEICKILFTYRYTLKRTELSDAMVEWLYEYSAGVISILVSLIHDAQEIAILNGYEALDMITLNEAYQKRLALRSLQQLQPDGKNC